MNGERRMDLSISLTDSQLQKYRKNMKNDINMTMYGLQSCSMNRLIPLGYAVANDATTRTPVLFVINWGH